MRKILSAESDPKHYRAEACVVWCFDDRFSKPLEALAQREKFKHYDLVRIAGGAKPLASLTQDNGLLFLLSQVRTSVLLHKAREIILMVHTDCGAYGGSKAFNGDVSEIHKLKQDLERAKTLLQRELSPETKIKGILADFHNLYEV